MACFSVVQAAWLPCSLVNKGPRSVRNGSKWPQISNTPALSGLECFLTTRYILSSNIWQDEREKEPTNSVTLREVWNISLVLVSPAGVMETFLSKQSHRTRLAARGRGDHRQECRLDPINNTQPDLAWAVAAGPVCTLVLSHLTTFNFRQTLSKVSSSSSSSFSLPSYGAGCGCWWS